MKNNKVFFLLVFMALVVSARAQTGENQSAELQSSGGSFTLTKSVVAGGGRELQQSPTLSAHGTAGQTVSGVTSQGGRFSLYSGFWTPENAAPTAALCVVSGQILNSANQKALSKVTVTITGANMITRTLETDREGKFTFTDIEAGGFYIVTVERRGYWFTPSNIAFNLVEDKSDVNFFGNLITNY